MLKEPVLFGLLPAAVVAPARVLSPLEVVTEASNRPLPVQPPQPDVLEGGDSVAAVAAVRR